MPEDNRRGACKLQWDALQAIRAAIILMSALVHEWLDTLAESAREGHAEPRTELAVARLEGCGVCFLCSPDVSIRRAAWDFLAAIRQLHMALSAAPSSSEPQPLCRPNGQ